MSEIKQWSKGSNLLILLYELEKAILALKKLELAQQLQRTQATISVIKETL